jgi:hypothetical protein
MACFALPRLPHVWNLAAHAGGGNAAAQAAKAAKSRGGLLEAEARQILNVKPKASESEITEAFEKLTSMNDESKGGSKYINQKFKNAHMSLVDAPKPDADPKNEVPKEDAK